MHFFNRRHALRAAAGTALGLGLERATRSARAQEPGARPVSAPGAEVINPRGRVPVSLIIDDSTCLVNLAHFCIPQFHEVFPNQYPQPWQTLPREIPDAFVRKFGEWSRERGVKGKYSVIPYPACVGWLDRDLPGWSKQALEESLDLVRTLLAPHWDFHPEMVSHTWVIDTKTGRPYSERTDKVMENWGWTDGKSADKIADYMSYALRILKNVGIPCEGITTPGGFGIHVLPELAQATLEACRDVFQAEIPHYFRHAFLGDESVAPRVEYASGLDGENPRCVVSIVACTGDWFGGWDGLTPGSADRFITADFKGGRLPEVIRRGEPAVLACHWPGIYFSGQETGFKILHQVVDRLDAGFDNLLWMKLSEISRYWAARLLTAIKQANGVLTFHAPFACPVFTVRIAQAPAGAPKLVSQTGQVPLKQVRRQLELEAGTWVTREREVTACFDLPKGVSRLEFPR